MSEFVRSEVTRKIKQLEVEWGGGMFSSVAVRCPIAGDANAQ